MADLSESHILFLATDGFENDELFKPRQALLDAGAKVTLASIKTDPIQDDKLVAAICHGPWLLAEADVIDGKRLTSWPSIRTDLANAGADVVDEEVVQDGKLITSRKPDDIPAFNKAIIAELSGALAEA